MILKGENVATKLKIARSAETVVPTPWEPMGKIVETNWTGIITFDLNDLEVVKSRSRNFDLTIAPKRLLLCHGWLLAKTFSALELVESFDFVQPWRGLIVARLAYGSHPSNSWVFLFCVRKHNIFWLLIHQTVVFYKYILHVVILNWFVCLTGFCLIFPEWCLNTK